jgi:hypothetical protein
MLVGKGVVGAGRYFSPCWLGRGWWGQVDISHHVAWEGDGGGQVDISHHVGWEEGGGGR